MIAYDREEAKMNDEQTITLAHLRRRRLMIEAYAVINEKLAAGETVAKTWLVETMLAKHDGISADDIRAAVTKCFKAFDPPDTSEGHRQHAEELRRAISDRAHARP